MFSYYGSKSKIIHLYPPPMFDTVVEPFAGSARYALRYPDRKVILNDLDPTIYGIWKWLVEEATVERVMAWPELKVGERLDQCDNLTQEERDIYGSQPQRGEVVEQLPIGYAVGKGGRGEIVGSCGGIVMENEVRLLRAEWARATEFSIHDQKDMLIYELFLLLEKMVDMIGDHENQLNHVHRVPGGEGEDGEK